MERLSTSYVFNRTLDGVTSNRFEMVEMYEQIASGKKIQKASDDPVLAARILDVQKNISDIKQAERYVITSLNDLANEESVLTQVQSLVLKARSLILQGTSDTQGLSGKTYVGQELNQVLEQVGHLSNSLNSDGAHIFAGYVADNPPYAFTRNPGGEIIAATYNGDNNSIEKSVSPGLRVAVSHPGSEIFNAPGFDVFAELVLARDALYAGVSPTNLSNVDAVYDNITKAMTDIGARTNIIESAQETNTLILNSHQTALGKIRDLDLPTAITRFTELEATMEAINTAFARVVKLSLFDYL
jgi:flagellar hook-associated protein 3 FlgL